MMGAGPPGGAVGVERGSGGAGPGVLVTPLGGANGCELGGWASAVIRGCWG